MTLEHFVLRMESELNVIYDSLFTYLYVFITFHYLATPKAVKLTLLKHCEESYVNLKS